MLSTADGRLRDIANAVIKRHDCSVISAWRGFIEQDDLYHRGLSQLQFPHSAHNQMPSIAIDLAPYNPVKGRVDWEDTLAFYYFAGIVMNTAEVLGIPLRWGGDWDMDDDLHDQTFMDLAHFELVLGEDDNA
jgi:peptidoglycan L-alanyl-D-glutamate endopeptidase CwlK